MREPAVAGMFYPASDAALRRELERCFSEVDPGLLPKGSPRIAGIVSPHAGYTYSGWIAAHGFRALNEGGLPRTVVFIGPNHTGYGSGISMSTADWRTPMGVMKCDRDLASSIDLPRDERSHLMEHSIEVQMPFLQYLDPSMLHVSISMLDQDIRSAIDVGKTLAKALEGRRDVSVVASSDFTHCGSNYGVPVPRGMNPGEYAKSIDVKLIGRLTEMDVQGAYGTRDDLGITTCGLGPISAMITAVRHLGATRSELIRYATSYDISPASSAVGYASMVLHG